MFDLSAVSTKDSFELHLRHPVTDELLYADEDKTQPVQIVLYSTSSKQYRQAINAMQNRQLKRNKKQATAEVMREEGIKLLAACSKEGVNLAFKGMALDSPEAFTELYEDDHYAWVKNQADEALGDIANFIQA